MNQKETQASQFCRQIAGLSSRSPKVLVNLVMALATDHGCHSVTELSTSPFFQYQYSSITDILTNMARNPEERRQLAKRIFALILTLLPRREIVNLALDSVPVEHPFSEVLQGLIYIAVANNILRGNKPVSVGYSVSSLNICLEKGWCLPLSLERISSEQSALELGLEQVAEVADDPHFKDSTILVSADSKYSSRKFLSPCFKHKNVVLLSRLVVGSKVYQHSPEQTDGAPKIYGDEWYLVNASGEKIIHRKGQEIRYYERSLHEQSPCETLVVKGRYTRKKRELVITLRRYNNAMIRSKQGVNMKEMRFDVLAVTVEDAKTGKRVFSNDMFIVISGERKDEITSLQAFEGFRSRMDIEPTFRVMKQKLLLDSYQPLSCDNFDNWLLVVQLALWLLWESSAETQAAPKKWQEYHDKSVRESRPSARLPLTQTIKATAGLFRTLDLKDFAPRKCENGKGRKLGEIQTPRTRYKVVRKSKKKAMNSS